MKRYLAVGINAYAGQELSGCVNDAYDWSESLGNRGFVGTVLTDGNATRAAITAELRDMLATARRGDSLVFQFSGHGTWVPDLDGDEIDHRDEAIVPYDYDTAGLITDDGLYRLVSDNRADGVKMLIISDSCNSGTVTRFLGANDRAALETARSASPIYHSTVAPRPKVRYMPPAKILTGDMLETARTVQYKPLSETSRTGAALFAACREDQVAYDASFKGRPNGAFTFAALQALRTANPSSLKSWHAATCDALVFDQAPQVGGTWWQKNVTRFV